MLLIFKSRLGGYVDLPDGNTVHYVYFVVAVGFNMTF